MAKAPLSPVSLFTKANLKMVTQMAMELSRPEEEF